jgi:4a-hydroxytetrahydrobiopterin dehydratase
MNWNKIETADGKSYLIKEFTFKNFVAAFAFMNKVAVIAEEQKHHPDWSNVYNKVVIKLSTHDEGDTVTAKDIELSRLIDLLLN